MIPNFAWIKVPVLCLTLVVAAKATAAERVLILEVVLNDHNTGHVGEFVERDGLLYARRSELSALGLESPGIGQSDDELLPLRSLPHLSAQVDEASQTLSIAAGVAGFKTTDLSSQHLRQVAPLTPGDFGVLLNYDASLTRSGGRTTGGALADLRMFGSHGVLESAFLVSLGGSRGQSSLVRLDTTYTYTQPSKVRRLRVGDVITGALTWSRAVRIGGIQIASDFGLRPDLVTYPLPAIGSSVEVPSTVNVMINGARQFSEAVNPGPFAVHSLPIVNGAGEMSVMVQDALGRQTVITQPFYASAALLNPGLASYSLEFGAVRKDYGLGTGRYSKWVLNASTRLGLTRWLTLEAHAEASNKLAVLGGGVVARAGTIGVFNAAVAASGSRSGSGRPLRGALIAAGFQRIARSLNFGVSGTMAIKGFRDIAAEHEAPVPKSTLQLNLGVNLNDWGNLGVAYNRHVASRREPAPYHADELVAGSYSVALARLATVYATASKSLRQSGGYGAAVGLSFGLGKARSANVESSLASRRTSHSFNIARTAHSHDDFGYRMRMSQGYVQRQSLETEYLASWGRVSAGIDRFSGQVAARTGFSGALVMASGGVFASDRISDSFAIVNTGEASGLPIMYENRLIGRTNAKGKLLVPALRSFEDNRLTVEATQVPPDIEIGRTAIVVRPGDRSGVPVDFLVRRVNAALITIHSADGRAVPPGSTVTVEGAEPQLVGHDGAAYVTGLKPRTRLDVSLVDGTSCAVEFDYRPVPNDIPVIGPLSCR